MEKRGISFIPHENNYWLMTSIRYTWYTGALYILERRHSWNWVFYLFATVVEVEGSRWGSRYGSKWDCSEKCGNLWTGQWSTSECGWLPIVWTVWLCSQPKSSQDSPFLASFLPHGFRWNSGFLSGHYAKVSKLEDKITTFDGNVQPVWCNELIMFKVLNYPPL